jgi:pyridoxal biosynthesis lyase PdxS
VCVCVCVCMCVCVCVCVFVFVQLREYLCVCSGVSVCVRDPRLCVSLVCLPVTTTPRLTHTHTQAGTGDVCEAVKHAKQLFREISALKVGLHCFWGLALSAVCHGVCAYILFSPSLTPLQTMTPEQLGEKATEYRVPVELVSRVRDLGRLPVVTFAAGGLATPADVALLFKLGVDGVFVGSGIFKSGDPTTRARAMVLAARHWNDPRKLAEISANIGEAMVGRIIDDSLTTRMAGREGGDPGHLRGVGFRKD